MKITNRVVVCAVVLCSLGLAIPVLAQSEPTIGLALPLTGKLGPAGKEILQAAELAAAEAQTKLIIVDTESTADGARNALNQLAQNDDVLAIVGPITTDGSLAAATIAEKYRIPIVSLSNDSRIESRSPWMFRFRLSSGEQAAQLAVVAFRDIGVKRVAVIYPTNAYGRDAVDGFTRAFLKAGGDVTTLVPYKTKTTNYTSTMEALIGRKVFVGEKRVGKWKPNRDGYARVKRKKKIDFDAIFIPDFHYRVARMLPFLPLVGIQNGDGGEGVAVQLLGLGGWQGSTMNHSGSVAAGAFYTDVFGGESSGGQAEEFVRVFHQATGRDPTDVDAEVFDLVWLLGKAIKRLNVSVRSRKGVRAAMPMERSWSGVTGRIRFDVDGGPKRDLEVFRFDADGFVAPAY